MSIDLDRVKRLLINTVKDVSELEREPDDYRIVDRFIDCSKCIDSDEVKRELADIKWKINFLKDRMELLFFQLDIKQKYDDHQEKKRQQEQKDKERHELANKHFMEKVEKLKDLTGEEKVEKLKIAMTERILEEDGLLRLFF